MKRSPPRRPQSDFLSLLACGQETGHAVSAAVHTPKSRPSGHASPLGAGLRRNSAPCRERSREQAGLARAAPSTAVFILGTLQLH